MSDLKKEIRFPLGVTVMTPNAQARIPFREVIDALRRHLRGDWGDVEEDDRQENETSLSEGFRLLSVYHTADGLKFWIITEADRSVTTILLPEDY